MSKQTPAGTPNFVSVACGGYKTSDGRINHVIYGCATDGRIYRYVKRQWEPVVSESYTAPRDQTERTDYKTRDEDPW